ncbi:MAG: hypothetical protein IT330_01265 [Anaerolineae bacterium]|nr:hypothetical protein [Anaerolineae bacterium]
MNRTLRVLAQVFVILALYALFAIITGTIAWLLGASLNGQIGWGFIGGSLLLVTLLYLLRRQRAG